MAGQTVKEMPRNVKYFPTIHVYNVHWLIDLGAIQGFEREVLIFLYPSHIEDISSCSPWDFVLFPL
jgi:hypothetical protein